jgi:hypothetical protein
MQPGTGGSAEIVVATGECPERGKIQTEAKCDCWRRRLTASLGELTGWKSGGLPTWRYRGAWAGADRGKAAGRPQASMCQSPSH